MLVFKINIPVELPFKEDIGLPMIWVKSVMHSQLIPILAAARGNQSDFLVMVVISFHSVAIPMNFVFPAV